MPANVSRRKTIFVAAFVLFAAVMLYVLFAPARRQAVVPVDGEHTWVEEAPVRRQIIWSPAEKVAAPAAEPRSFQACIF